MFTPTHFVQTDEYGTKNNHVENGQLVEELGRVTSVLGGSTLVDLETDAGEPRSVFDTRLQPFDVSKHQVTCKYSSSPHHFTGNCPDARIVTVPEPAEPERPWYSFTIDSTTGTCEEFTWPVGTIVRRPDLGEAALFVVEERLIDHRATRGYAEPVKEWADAPYRLRSLTQAVPENFQGLLWASSARPLVQVEPVRAATIMLEEGKRMTNELAANLASALRDAAAELEAVIQ